MIYQGLLFFILLWVVYYVALPFLIKNSQKVKMNSKEPEKKYSEEEELAFDKELGILSKDE